MKTTTKQILLAVALVGALAFTTAHAQQVPIPTTAAEVAGPAPGPMPKAQVQMMGRMAYFWGWPLVYVYNQRTELTKVPESGLARWRHAHQPDEPSRNADQLH